MGEQGERPQQDQDFGEVSTIKSLLRLRQFVKPYRFRFFSGFGHIPIESGRVSFMVQRKHALGMFLCQKYACVVPRNLLLVPNRGLHAKHARNIVNGQS